MEREMERETGFDFIIKKLNSSLLWHFALGTTTTTSCTIHSPYNKLDRTLLHPPHGKLLSHGIIFNVWMPGMNGMRVFEFRQRKRPALKDNWEEHHEPAMAIPDRVAGQYRTGLLRCCAGRPVTKRGFQTNRIWSESVWRMMVMEEKLIQKTNKICVLLIRHMSKPATNIAAKKWALPHTHHNI